MLHCSARCTLTEAPVPSPDVDHDLTVFHLDRVRFQVDAHRGTLGLARAVVEAAIVLWTLDDVVHHQPVAQVNLLVRAQAVRRIKLVIGRAVERIGLAAVIEALNALKRPCEVTLFLDSEYVRKGITEWIHGWKARGWKTAARAPVKNVDLWQKLDAVVTSAGHKIEWRWVKGHAGDPGNERADALANRGVALALGR